MKGYCAACKKMVEVLGIRTVRMPNLSPVHRGTCACGARVIVKIHDHEIILGNDGQMVPAEVYAGKDTPKRYVSQEYGQTVHLAGESVEVKPAGGEVRTLAQAKIQVERERTGKI